MHTKPNKVQIQHWPDTARQILESAANIIAEKFVAKDAFCNPQATKDFLMFKLASHEREVFAVMLLDNQNQLIEFKELFFGTIDAAHVYPREVVKTALYANAAAVILAHNHPSGEIEPSASDRAITKRLVDALALIDVRVLDHVIVGKEACSFAERGLI
ncbi:DNA repair protein RadC [Motilimonas sp. 1_MG-2023]|uniref:RadC family protein n=1 Tax=Motilimonas sp. 1_MG-2023 TaxID=3062672 RepID=UPI0026E15715|nr:DNA repair protein RadC [Motilimonas sp. 1_MG-2023]MDO6528228.1 DNA repair protein RadC [Motilimonas sp. 1_MG-2023]